MPYPAEDLELMARVVRERDRLVDYEDGDVPETLETLIQSLRDFLSRWGIDDEWDDPDHPLAASWDSYED